jgi:dienelactone hydrolase
MRAVLVAILGFSLSPAFPQGAAPPATPARLSLSLNDLYAEEGVGDAAVSPGGRYLAIVAHRPTDDIVVVVDLNTGERKAVTRMARFDVDPLLKVRIHEVVWKSDTRLLFQVQSVPRECVSYEQLNRGAVSRLGQRLYAIDRDGKSLVGMLEGNSHSATRLARDRGNVRSLLYKDPDHILMMIDGMSGRSLFKVDVNTGKGEIAEPARQATIGWWLDLDGIPIVRVEASRGTMRYLRREAGDKWKLFYSVRLREFDEQEEFTPIGTSDRIGMHYVLARPEGAQRYGVYLFDLEKESFGEPLAQSPEYDVFTARVSRDGKSLHQFCYVAHVRVCEFTDPKVQAHMKGVRKFFQDSANVYVVDGDEAQNTLVLYVEGPSDPPAWYYYRVDSKRIEVIGPGNEILATRALPTASIVEWQSSDGRRLTGYLTRPPGTMQEKKLATIVMPHGGPESRDHLKFDRWVQWLAARGYAVFQPNFRGSSGFSRDFAESGYGEWGRKMQDDITFGMKALVDQGIADPKRSCIVGASYGGYAALSGATLTPELFNCAVSIAGISDLTGFIEWRRNAWGSDSEGYKYWLKAIGDPDKDAQRLNDVSPLKLVDKVKAHVLLIHGRDDYVVPFEQSVAMKAALDNSGHPTELVELRGEGHSGWSRDNERKMLTAVDAFLWDNIGPGFGPQAAPQRFNVEKKR